MLQFCYNFVSEKTVNPSGVQKKNVYFLGICEIAPALEDLCAKRIVPGVLTPPTTYCTIWQLDLKHPKYNL